MAQGRILYAYDLSLLSALRLLNIHFVSKQNELSKRWDGLSQLKSRSELKL